jgi:hypothetical protein
VSEPVSKSIKMIADVGGSEPIDAGHCHPSQARILVKKQLASWQDGKLLVQIRPTHLMVANNTINRKDGDPNVSKAEVERRTEWFQSIIQAVAGSDTHGSDLDRILGYTTRAGMRVVDPRQTLEEIQALAAQSRHTRDRMLLDIKESGEPELDEWEEGFFKKDHRVPTEHENLLESLWPTSPSVEHVFGSGLAEPIPTEVPDFEPMGRKISRSVTAHRIPIYTPEDVVDGGIVRLAVPFPKMRRDRAQRKRDGTLDDKVITRTCPTCGAGTDDDGDGNCALCRTTLQIPTIR